MRIVPFFKKSASKQFNFTPRHYDPIKEDVERRKKIIEADLEGRSMSSMDASYMRGQFNVRRKAPHTSTLRLIIFVILVGLIVIAYIMISKFA